MRASFLIALGIGLGVWLLVVLLFMVLDWTMRSLTSAWMLAAITCGVGAFMVAFVVDRLTSNE